MRYIRFYQEKHQLKFYDLCLINVYIFLRIVTNNNTTTNSINNRPSTYALSKTRQATFPPALYTARTTSLTVMQSTLRSSTNQLSANYIHSTSHTTSTPTTTSRNYYLNTSGSPRNGAGFSQPTSSPRPKSSMPRADPAFPLWGP